MNVTLYIVGFPSRARKEISLMFCRRKYFIYRRVMNEESYIIQAAHVLLWFAFSMFMKYQNI